MVRCRQAARLSAHVSQTNLSRIALTTPCSAVTISATMPLFRTVLVVSALVASVGCSGGGNSANSPVSPSNTTLLGVWTGTVTRPAGFPPLSVRWETPTLNDYSLTGPLTLTNGSGVSVTVTGQGNTAGNDRLGYTIHMSFQSDAVSPNCTVRGNTTGSQTGDPFPAPYKSISVPAFNVTYASCGALVGQNNLQETAQLSLTKQ